MTRDTGCGFDEQPGAVLGVLGGLVGVADTVPYVRDTVRGSIRPHRGSWLTWGVPAIIACLSQRAGGASWPRRPRGHTTAANDRGAGRSVSARPVSDRVSHRISLLSVQNVSAIPDPAAEATVGPDAARSQHAARRIGTLPADRAGDTHLDPRLSKCISGAVLSADPDRRGDSALGFHTGQPITGATGSYARGHGDISLSANTVSAILCQVDRFRHHPDRLILMTVEHHLVYHSHHAVMWGVPGNMMKIIVRVKSSTDPRCPVGTHVSPDSSFRRATRPSRERFAPGLR